MHKLHIVKDPTWVNEETSLHVRGENEYLEGLRESYLGEMQLLHDRLSSTSMELILDFIGKTGLLER